MHEATLRLFNAIQISQRTTTPHPPAILERTIKQGYLLDPAIAPDDALLAAIERVVGLSGEQANAAFHKSWRVVQESPLEMLILQQIIHYLTTYGLEQLGIDRHGILYIPAETLELPALQSDIPLRLIKGLDAQAILARILTLGAGIALAPTTLADMVSRMNHPGGGQTILLQQSDDGKDVGDHQHQQHVVVTTSNEAGETIVIRNLEEHSPEMQKEILNALLQHHAETQQQQHQQHHVIETTDADGTHATLRYVIDSRHDNANVKVEAEPASGAEMSPDSLTAISGHHPETSGHVTIKSDDDMNRISVNEFLSK